MGTAVAPASEIPLGERKTFDIDGREVTVLNVGGEFHAVENVCPHMEGPVARGPVEEAEDGRCVITCPFHRWRFDLDTGDSIFPGRKRLRKHDVSLETFDVAVDGGMLVVDL